MRLFGKKYTGTISAFALVAVFVAIALANNIANTDTDIGGFHRLHLGTTSSTGHQDTGVGFFRVYANGKDTTVDGIFFNAIRDSYSGFRDTFLAIGASDSTAGGNSKLISGTITGAGTTLSGTLYVQSSDTARNTITATFSDSRNSTGTWSSALTSLTGTETSTFHRADSFSTKTMRFDTGYLFANSTGESFPVSARLAARPESTTFTTAEIGGAGRDTVLFVYIDGADSRTDTARIIVVGPNNRIVADSALRPVEGDVDISASTFAISSNLHPNTRSDTYFRNGVRIDTGATHIILIYWDAAQQKYKFGFHSVTVQEQVATITGGTGSATATFATTSNVATATINVDAVTTPRIGQITLSDVGNDGRFKADGFASIDSNTSSFDTRVDSSVFDITLLGATDSEPITRLTSGSVRISVRLLTTVTDSSSMRVIHHNVLTNSWELAGTSQTFDVASGSIFVTGATAFSNHAVGAFSSSSSTPAADDDDCVINNTIGRTSLSSVIPGLRGVRDSFLSTPVGRLFVSGYYSLGMLALAAALGIGYAKASKKN